MSEEDATQAFAIRRPTTNDETVVWKAYWKEQGQPWRTEPEIDEERQKYLAKQLCITPDIEKGVYPFKDIKLSRSERLMEKQKTGRPRSRNIRLRSVLIANLQ